MTGLLTLLTSAITLCAAAATDTAVGDSKPAPRGSKYYAEAQACLKSVAAAREWARAELGDDVAWLNEPVTCEVAADTGCGSAMSGHELEFLTGEPGHCGKAALIPAYVFHEWAHGLNHEFARVRWQTLDEALADTFAIYYTGDPRFGQGMYLDRETSWQRDLSDRKTYDGETKQLYTQSETLSGAWWDFRVRLVSAFGTDAGAAAAKSVFFQHLRELSGAGTSPGFLDDYEFARAAVTTAPALSSDDGRRSQVACALANSFLDHGFAASLDASCARAPLVTADEEILASAASSVAASAIAGRGFPVALSGKTSLRFAFHVTAAPGATTRALIVRTKIVHPFSEDLVIRITAPGGVSHEIYKGEEELAVPTLLTDRARFSGARAAGTWLVEVTSLGKGFEGEVQSLDLSLLEK